MGQLRLNTQGCVGIVVGAVIGMAVLFMGTGPAEAHRTRRRA